jgi:hypothetical protein
MHKEVLTQWVRPGFTRDSTRETKNKITAGRLWLTPVFPATEEAAIRKKIVVRSQPGQIVHETLSQKNPSQK